MQPVYRLKAAGRIMAVICATLVAGSALAQEGAARFRAYTGAAPPDASRLAAFRGKDTVQVVVVMSEDSVATARSRAPGHLLSNAERSTVEARVADQHSQLRPALEAAGGHVLASYHSALNGMKVEVESRKVADLARMPGVVSVRPVGRYHLENTVAVPFIGAPAVWNGADGLHGEHIKIAIIDTGIDYTHADFGGPGTVAAFTAAAASSTLPADPTLFGPAAPKVKGGIDLVGDAYNADVSTSVPVPDANPLDCNGHGSHVAGTAAGFGVTAAGSTYSGSYDSSIYASTGFAIGPGVAPKADLYAVRVFGCAGSTNVVTDAIDWAVKNDMDVISMSLGSDFGVADTADALAATNAAQAGIVVVAAAGNAGSAPYIVSTPSTGDGVLSVAATDAHASFPGALLTPTPGTPITAQDSNGLPLPGSALQVYVLPDTKGTGAGGVSLGCDPAEYDPVKVAGKLVVTVRGTCDRVLRAIYGQQAGAAAVALINNGPGYPPYEGAITGDPSTGPYAVTIPFLGVQPTDAADLAGATTTLFAAASIPNPGYRVAASFSSAGPRIGDSALKPAVTAPGVALVSVAVGTGTGFQTDSGTSMATPMVSGSSALARQAHPDWDAQAVAAAIAETADPAQLTDYAPRSEGAGLVQPLLATRTHAVVVPRDQPLATSLSFGFAEFQRDFHSVQVLRVLNDGDQAVTFNVSANAVGGAPHTVGLSQSTVRVRAHGQAQLAVSLLVPAATVGATHDALGNDVYQEVSGYLSFTPAAADMNGGVSLHVPYYLVPRARSAVRASAPEELPGRAPQSVVQLSNRGGAIPGNGDFYAWGLSGTRQGVQFLDVRAVGVQTNPVSASDSLLVFAINTFDRFNTPAIGEYDILIDVNGDGVADYDVFAIDDGFITTGLFNGQMVVGLANLATGAVSLNFLADAPTDGSTLLLPVFASSMGVSPANSRISYQVVYNSYLDGSSGAVPGTASFDVFNPSISNAMFVPVAPGTSVSVPFQIVPSQWATSPALGLMVVTQDNGSGADQAKLLPVKLDH